MTSIESVLITGANAGIGKDTARQLGLLPTTKKVFLGCRNPQKAEAAKAELVAATGRDIFEVLIIDVADLASVRVAVEALPQPVGALVMNAGGPGGRGTLDRTADGVTRMFAVNVLGHSVLAEGLIEAGKLGAVALYAGSEAARGVPALGMARPKLPNSSVDDFASIADGSFTSKRDPNVHYGYVKYMGAMWMSSMARRHPSIRFVTMSPGATSGTSGADEMSAFQRFMFTRIAFPLMTLFGRAHGVSEGAKRHVRGHFYASAWPTTAGKVVDQAPIFPDLGNEAFQENAHEAVNRFV